MYALILTTRMMRSLHQQSLKKPDPCGTNRRLSGPKQWLSRRKVKEHYLLWFGCNLNNLNLKLFNGFILIIELDNGLVFDRRQAIIISSLTPRCLEVEMSYYQFGDKKRIFYSRWAYNNIITAMKTRVNIIAWQLVHRLHISNKFTGVIYQTGTQHIDVSVMQFPAEINYR